MIRFPILRSQEPEIIGVPECPLFHRWTLVTWGDGSLKSTAVETLRDGSSGGKLLLHHFLSTADDRSVHDHPRGFWTLVLRGGYDDLAPCEACCGWTGAWTDEGTGVPRWVPGGSCEACGGRGVLLRERMRAGMLRYRPAAHRHRTKVHEGGCWTLVVMGRLERPWGFWHLGRWLPFKEYERRYGAAMRCD